MRYRCKCLVFLSMTILSVLAMTSYTKADSNMDGGGSGGGTESGTSQNYYSSGDDGMRITVIDTSTNRRAEGTTTIDYFKKNNKSSGSTRHFGKVNKLEYMGVAGYSSARSLAFSSEGYRVNNNGKTVGFYVPELPVIVSSSQGNSDIEEIKRYVNHGTTLKDIAARVGMSYDEMINGNYKIIVEPIIYLTFEGNYIAMTAHEAALLDMMLGGTKTTGGGLRAKFVSFTHKNLPLAIFLEKKDLAVNRWTGSKYNRVSNGDVLTYLGIGILSFGSPPETNTEVETASFSYRPDTDVITSVVVSAYGEDGATCDNPITVQFSGELVPTTQVGGIVIPSGGSRLVWFKWRTPKVTQQTVSYVYVDILAGDGGSSGSIKIKINPLGEREPYNPTADDTKPYGWSSTYLPSIPVFPKAIALSKYAAPLKSTSWHTYTCTKRRVWTGSYTDADGNKHDTYRFVYDFTVNSFTATLTSTNAQLRPDSYTTASNKRPNEIKSGYGVELKVNSNISTSGSYGDVTGIQNALIYFPEFFYNTYHRIGKLPGAALNSTIEFPVNLYSMHGSRIHFLPVWYPDKEYIVYIESFDAWTPAGMLCNNATASINVKGSLWDDWHVGIIKNR